MDQFTNFTKGDDDDLPWPPPGSFAAEAEKLGVEFDTLVHEIAKAFRVNRLLDWLAAMNTRH